MYSLQGLRSLFDRDARSIEPKKVLEKKIIQKAGSFSLMTLRYAHSNDDVFIMAIKIFKGAKPQDIQKLYEYYEQYQPEKLAIDFFGIPKHETPDFLPGAKLTGYKYCKIDCVYSHKNTSDINYLYDELLEK